VAQHFPEIIHATSRQVELAEQQGKLVGGEKSKDDCLNAKTSITISLLSLHF